MNRYFLSRLILGSLGFYILVVALISYFHLVPAEISQGATALVAAPGQGPAFVQSSISTPTPFAGARPVPAPPPFSSSPLQPSSSLSGISIPSSAVNIVLLGTDKRDPSQANWRTDTIILASVDQQRKSVGLLSIPRDLWVRIPGVGDQRINTADFYGEYYRLPGGGPQTIKATIEQNLGIRVHYYVRVGFDAFRKAIDTLGGVDIAVDCPLHETGFSDDYGTVNLDFTAGVHHMDGVTALRYARSRYTTSDYDRSRRQRQVLLAMWDRAATLELLPRWPQLYAQFRQSIQTDLGPLELASLGFTGTQLRMSNVKSRAIDNRSTTPWVTPDGEQVLLPLPDKIRPVLEDLFSPDNGGSQSIEAEKARIQVLSSVPTTANSVSVSLRRLGLKVDDPRIITESVPFSYLVVYHGKPSTEQKLLDTLSIDASRVRTVSDPNAQTDIQVILAPGYNTCQK